jgi:hypothetical protein
MPEIDSSDLFQNEEAIDTFNDIISHRYAQMYRDQNLAASNCANLKSKFYISTIDTESIAPEFKVNISRFQTILKFWESQCHFVKKGQDRATVITTFLDENEIDNEISKIYSEYINIHEATITTLERYLINNLLIV